MRGSLTGDLDVLIRFGDSVAKLGSPDTLRAVNAALADEALFLVQDQFAKERDPYGRPWFPKKYPNGRKTLVGSGKLIKSFRRFYLGPDCAIVGSTAFHAQFAQSGTGIYGPRKSRIYPKRAKALRFKGAGGKFIFAKSSEGSRQRLLFPVAGVPSPIWMLALRRRAQAVLRSRITRTARAA
jgi:phage gpG-like protein